MATLDGNNLPFLKSTLFWVLVCTYVYLSAQICQTFKSLVHKATLNSHFPRDCIRVELGTIYCISRSLTW